MNDPTDEVDVPASFGKGAALISAERLRQITDEQYDADHDDGHSEGELAWAAVAYAAPDPQAIRRGTVVQAVHLGGQRGISWRDPWPWGPTYDKRPPPDAAIEDRIRGLVKAGAFVAAEIDRLLRVADKRMPDEVWVAAKEKYNVTPEDRDRVLFYKRTNWGRQAAWEVTRKKSVELGVDFFKPPATSASSWQSCHTTNYWAWYGLPLDGG